MGFVILLGVCLILYAGLGFIYIQQEPKQKSIEEQISKTMAIVSKPLPDIKKLQAQYDAVNQKLVPVELTEALEIIVGIAEESGIDVDPNLNKLRIPSPTAPKTQTVGGATFTVQSFNQVKVQGDYDSVMSFIADLDSGSTNETMFLRRVDISHVEIRYTDEEAARRTEFREVIAAVLAMMTDNGLSKIPNPLNYKGGVATSNMTVFPDVTTTAVDKGYTGTANPKAGYLLYQHDRISSDDTTVFKTTNYIARRSTQYYYICEVDSTVRQFDGTDIAKATEYSGSEEFFVETVASVDIDLYTKPVKEIQESK
jgi:hypothetical protein